MLTTFKAKHRVNRPGLILLLAVLTLVGACSRKTPETGAQPPTSTEQQSAAATETETADSIALLKRRFQQGIDALALRDYARAQRIFGEILRENPGLSGPHANLALIDFRQQKYQKSFERVTRAIGLNPRNAQAYHLRAQLHLQNGKIKLARQDYEKAIELDSDYLNAHYNLALLYDIYLQEIALAIEHYLRYLALLEKPDPTLQDWVKHLRGTLENG